MKSPSFSITLRLSKGMNKTVKLLLELAKVVVSFLLGYNADGIASALM